MRAGGRTFGHLGRLLRQNRRFFLFLRTRFFPFLTALLKSFFLLFLRRRLLRLRQRLFLRRHAHFRRTLSNQTKEAVRRLLDDLHRAAILRETQGEECSFNRFFHRLSGSFHEIRHIRQLLSFPCRPRFGTSTTAARSARGSSSPNREQVPKRNSS